MKYLVLFFAIFIGLNLKSYPIAFAILLFLLLVYTFKKYGYKISLFILAISLIFFGISFITFRFYSTSYTGVVIEAKDNYFIFLSKMEKIYVYSKSHRYEIGDILKIEGSKSSVNFTVLESAFDFNDYLANKGVFDQIEVSNIRAIFSNPIRIRNYINNVLSQYNSSTSNLIKTLLFSSGESQEIKTSLSYLHLSRLLSLSGVYIHAFISFITYFLSFKLKEKWAKLISILFLGVYLIFAFPRFTIVRIFSLLVFRYINKYHLKDKFDYLSLISITGIFFLIIDYHLAYQDSFILGYFIPISSYFLNGTIKCKNRFIKKSTLGILILISLIPFEIKYYHSINLLLYPLQIILTPLFMIYGFLSLLAIFYLPLMNILNGYTTFLGNFATWLKSFALLINIPPFSMTGIVIFESFFYLIIYYRGIYFKKIYKSLIAVSVLTIIVYIIPFHNLCTCEVSFINVNQGDSCLIREGTTTVLIDTGGSIYNDIANNTLIPYLRKKRIYNLDLVITTHDDYDHSGALGELKKNMKVKNYIDDYQDFPLTIHHIKFINYNTYLESWSEENDQSLVIGFEMKDVSFLIMGDAPIKIEKLILNDYPKLTCDVLKVGHHGSSTSTCNEFIQSIKPKDAIISVGKNYYGHPTSSVLSILENNHVNIKRTDKEGTISYTFHR